jgi:uncharacterized protein
MLRNDEHKGTSKRGFAAMDQAKQRQIASKGGRSVPAVKRSFSQDPQLAAEAGRKGGESVPPEGRSFSQNRALAAEAGRKGGQARGASNQQAKLAALRPQENAKADGRRPGETFDGAPDSDAKDARNSGLPKEAKSRDEQSRFPAG